MEESESSETIKRSLARSYCLLVKEMVWRFRSLAESRKGKRIKSSNGKCMKRDELSLGKGEK